MIALAAIAKGPTQINLVWSATVAAGYGYLVEIQSATDPRYTLWTEYQPVPAATPFAGDPMGAHLFPLPNNGVPPWVVEPQYEDPTDNSAAQFIVSGLLPATFYRFRVRTYRWNSAPAYGPYSLVAGANTLTYTQLHVSPTGSDAGDGSAGNPWKTLGHAASVLASGQILMVAPGTYAETVTFQQPANSGSIVIYGPGATISGTLYVAGYGVVIDSLKVANTTQEYAVTVSGIGHFLLGIETDTSTGGWGVHLSKANNCLISRCYLHDAGNPAVDGGQGGFLLALEGSSNNVVWGNRLTRGSHDCSLAKGGSQGNRWLNNVMDGGWGMGFEAIQQSTGNLIEGNIIFHVQMLMGATYKPGIEISSAANTVRRNLVLWAKSWPIEVSALYGGDSCRGVLVYNNTFVGNGGCLFQSQNDGGALGDSAYAGFLYANNICVDFMGPNATDIYRANLLSQIVSNSFLPFTRDPNSKCIIWDHMAQGTFQYPVPVRVANAAYTPPFSNNVTCPPRFVDPASNDYRIHPTSELAGAAVPVTDPNWPAPASVDLGAFGLTGAAK